MSDILSMYKIMYMIVLFLYIRELRYFLKYVDGFCVYVSSFWISDLGCI